MKTREFGYRLVRIGARCGGLTKLCRDGTLAALLIYGASSAGAYPRPGDTSDISVRLDGTPTPSNSYIGAISGDGKRVGFQSFAPDLVSGDGNHALDEFVRDVTAGVTTRVDLASDGTEATGELEYPNIFSNLTAMSMSGDGRYVAFMSHASNLVPNDTDNDWDIFLRDCAAGTTELISNSSTSPSISADGRFIAFAGDVLYLRDRIAGTTEQVDVSSSGEPANFYGYGPTVSDDGRFVAFQSSANNLDPDPTENIFAEGAAIYLRDRLLGTTKRITNSAPTTQANGNSYMPHISGDGRYIAYTSAATDLVPNDVNRSNDVFVYDRLSNTTRRVSVASDGTEANGLSYGVSISRDGRFVAFASPASNLVPNDTNGITDVFVHDMLLGITERVSIATDRSEPTNSGTPVLNPTVSEYPVVSDDGAAIAFQSTAGNLVPNGTANADNAYLRRRGAPIGIFQANVTQTGNSGQISGVATLSGAIVSAATHPAQPQPQVEVPGGDIASAELAVRTEQEDLRLRIVVPTLPSVQVSGLAGRLACFEVGCPPSVTDSPYVGYRVDFLIGSTPYRIVLDESGAVLEQCSIACVPMGALTPVVGVTGTEVVLTVPLSSVGANSGMPVTGIVITSTLLGPVGSPQDVDTLTLPDTTIAGPVVRIGVAAPDVPPEQVSYSAETIPTAGSFNATFTGPSDGSAAVLWAQPCVGSTCGAPMSWPLAARPAVQLNNVWSRKIHGSAGTFDVDLTTGNRIECRSGGTNGSYTIVFSFANPLTSVDGASITAGTGSVASANIDGTDSHNYIVTLSGVTNAQSITVTLSNVADSAGNLSSTVSGSMKVLVGDTNGDGFVNSADISQTKSQSGQPLTSSNFREDLNADGFVNSADISLVKSKSGTALP